MYKATLRSVNVSKYDFTLLKTWLKWNDSIEDPEYYTLACVKVHKIKPKDVLAELQNMLH